MVINLLRAAFVSALVRKTHGKMAVAAETNIVHTELKRMKARIGGTATVTVWDVYPFLEGS